MLHTGLKKLVQCFGPDTNMSWVRWAPSSDATQTLTEAHGVSSITRTGSLAELIALANDIRTQYTAHIADDTAHVAPDEVNVLASPAATDLTTALALLNEVITAYTAHIADTDAHDPADSTNVITASAATNRETAVTLAADIKTQYTAHIADATSHDAADATNVITAVLNVAGAYRINLKQKGGYHFPVLGTVDNGTTLYYFLEPTEMDSNEGTVDIRLRSVAFASVASGPAHTDTIDELQAIIFQPSTLTKRCGAKDELKVYGPKCDWAYARWAPSGSAAQTLTEAHGITGVARSGAGAWTVSLANPCEAMLVLISYIENDTTHYHVADVTATNAAAGTFTARHRSVAYASVASGPSASDTVDQIEVLVLQRMAT